MRSRTIGKTGIQVSEIGIGTWELSGDVWGPTEDSESILALKTGVDAGATFIDTAAGYGGGHVESLIGQFLRESCIDRSELVLSTKIKPQNGMFAPPPEIPISEAYDPRWIRRQCEESLGRLGTEYVDLLFMHTWSRSWGHETEWFGEMQRLKEEGKVRAIGISIPDEGITDANVHIATGRIDVVQCVYSAFQQEPEYSLFPLAEEFGVGVVARSPFSSGAIVQDWTPDTTFVEGDWRGSWPLKVKPGWLEDQAAMADQLRPILEATGVSRSCAALKYVLSCKSVSTVIPGSSNPRHVRENMQASDGSPLDVAVLARIRELWRERALHGTYNGSI
jgi:aryl-alcohol dehydrogenase-like predicted oxidoreductase